MIIISGVDGSGKSTQLALLKRYLELKGFSVGYTWLRWFAVFTYYSTCMLSNYVP